jgi:2-oxoglutarate ferredoxin oxidoreductase subunit alpha
MRINNVTLKAGGEAGSGIATIGMIFAKLMQRSGLYVFSTNDYPSLIRGGHNTITIRASDQKIHALHGPTDILIGLDKLTIATHAHEMAPGGAIIYDSTRIKETDVKINRTDIRLFPVPLTQIAVACGGELFFNQVAIGSTLALLGMDLTLLTVLIEKTFGRKGPEIVAKNVQAAQGGWDHVQPALAKPFDVHIQPRAPPSKMMLIMGNDAICSAAIAAGLKLVAEYPMSPSSSVLHWMAAHAVKHKIVVKHTEDEIAAMNWLCGAGFAGVRTMTATSGGGFSLMAEALGNAGIAEIPCVIVNDMRCGPSTGLPTYTEQADLLFALHASQGEFPRIVAIPGDPEECFYMTFDVFNMADAVQTPAIILVDKYLAEAAVTIPYINASELKINRGALQTDAQMEQALPSFTPGGFKRHEITESGVSPRCIPGQKNGIHVCSSYEHDETGYTSEEAHMRVLQIDKRTRKMNTLDPALYQPSFHGDSKSPFLLVTWGSTKAIALEALKLLEAQNVSVRMMQIRYAAPFATEAIKRALLSASKVLICEGNSEGQMRALIAQKTGVQIPNIYLRYDGRPFEPADIADRVKELIEGDKSPHTFVHPAPRPGPDDAVSPVWAELKLKPIVPASPPATAETTTRSPASSSIPAPSAAPTSSPASTTTPVARVPTLAPTSPVASAPAPTTNVVSKPTPSDSTSHSTSAVASKPKPSELSKPIIPDTENVLSPSELAEQMRRKSKGV